MNLRQECFFALHLVQLSVGEGFLGRRASLLRDVIARDLLLDAQPEIEGRQSTGALLTSSGAFRLLLPYLDVRQARLVTRTTFADAM